MDADLVLIFSFVIVSLIVVGVTKYSSAMSFNQVLNLRVSRNYNSR